MHNESKNKSESECAVCYVAHDDEIHEATLRIHQWFFKQVTHSLEDETVFAPELEPKLAAS